MAGSSKEQQIENKEWIDSIKWVLEHESKDRAEELIGLISEEVGSEKGGSLHTPYQNTLPASADKKYPGDLKLEERLYNAIRWNAMAIVARANKRIEGIGGHISTYASASNLWEVGLNHFWRSYENGLPDLVYFQGHASPGLYSRSFVEHRFDEENLDNFREEITSEKGLSSYPHPRLMPEYWRFPTVSMGLTSIQSIYQARFLKYLEKRGLAEKTDRPQRVWAMLGDGEMDEPESMGAIGIAAREKLNNLTFVINCNLQRLDGPVRGNSNIIKELEGRFRGAGWKVIKLLWGKAWDELFEKDKDGKLLKKLDSMPDGELQRMAQMSPEELKKDFFGDELAHLIEGKSEEDLHELIRGGHDPEKIYTAYSAAIENEDGPTVILAQTIKGWEQGKEAGEASNVSHKSKKITGKALKAFRDALELDISDEELGEWPYFRFEEDSEEAKYLKKRREELGGPLPQRKVIAKDFKMPDEKVFEEFLSGSGGDEAGVTMAFVKMLTKLMRDKNMGKHVVPIIPDESRTFGMDSLFRKFGIYASEGQKYEPVDKDSLMFYNESKEGAILEEGITEAGSMASFIAAGTHHMTQPFYTIPFFAFYSMFGFQRIGDLIWAACDARAKGFLIGGIAGRTSLSGEGLQHIDGNSHLYALAYPSVKAYDPAFAFELAVIIKNGLQEMYADGEDWIYYLTLTNQTYPMPKMPDGVEEDILKGLYLFRESGKDYTKRKVNLMGSGAIMDEVLKAAETLEEDYDLAVDIWSATSYKALYDDARDTERINMRKRSHRKSHLQKQLGERDEPFVAATDYVKALPLSISKWMPDDFVVLGTDGFGRSDTVEALRNFFEVDAVHITYHALYLMVQREVIEEKVLVEFAKKNDKNPDKQNPASPQPPKGA